MEILTEYVSSVLRYCSTYPYRVAIGIGTVAVTYGAVRVYFGGGVCYSKAVLPGKTAIITGGNTGIGLETAVDLAKRGARVILACRNTERGEKAVAIVKRRSKNENVSFSKLDLASLQSVREFSARIIEEESHIDILINNAGVMAPPYTTTEDGFELQFGVNHLGHFLLTNLLLGRIKEAPVARIINLSSRAHRTGNIDFADLQSKQCYKRREAYSQSKLANILFTKALSHQLEGTNVTAYSVHPGLVHTQLFRHFSQSLKFFFWPAWVFIKSPWQGAQTTIYCAVSEGIESLSGQYFVDCKPCEVAHPMASDDQAAHRLWQVSAQLVGLETKVDKLD